MLDTVGGIYSRFNPRICKRCDFNVTDSEGRPVVSIHASVKDATRYYYDEADCRRVSIHASVKDATLIYNISIKLSIVSIHASVKDATYYCPQQHPHLQVSIHASVKDATFVIFVFLTKSEFQSTHL